MGDMEGLRKLLFGTIPSETSVIDPGEEKGRSESRIELPEASEVETEAELSTG
jgi:hypothetical protein